MNIDQLKDGKIFSCVFTKRTTGEPRKIVARTGVTAFVSGNGRKWTDEDKNVLTVYDMQNQGYRCISLENIEEITHHGIKEIDNG